MLCVAIGISGATVMPHNLYLLSSIVQTRKYEQNPAGKRRAIKFATIGLDGRADVRAVHQRRHSLIVSAAAFIRRARQRWRKSGRLQFASPALGVGAPAWCIAVALLASGQNSTLTGMRWRADRDGGFLNIRLRPWLRRLITRLIAIIPAVIVTMSMAKVARRNCSS